jgi:glycosyltransferase involved in cell wall biosynthesis
MIHMDERIHPDERPRADGPVTSLLITGLGQGGAETQLVALARDLASRGWDVEVVSLLPAGPGSVHGGGFGEELAAGGIPVYSPALLGPRALPSALWALLRHWRGRRPDVVCTFMFHANVVGTVVGRLAGVPAVATSIRNERFGPRWRERLEALTQRLSDVTVVNSESVAASLLARGVIPPDRCRVIPNAVDLARFAPRDPATRDATRRRLGVPPHGFLWLTVGRLYPQKDHASLLAALRIVRGRFRGVRLAVAGDGPLAACLRQQVRQAALTDTVHWLGARTDVADLLAASDAFVLPSRWEGSPNAVLEALAAGVPVAATDVGGVRELVQDGASGYLAPPGDAAALAAAMERLMALRPEARERLGRHGRESVRQRHEVSTVMARWRDVLCTTWMAGRGGASCGD